MTLVSVIIPAYNRAGVVRRAIESVLSQCYTQLEVLVVDDSSTDDTAEVVAACARDDRRVRLLRHTHRRGAQAARNSGIRAAQGTLIAFLDSDDYWLPESLTIRLQHARSQQVHMVHSECLVLQPGETELQPFGVPPMDGHIYTQVLRRPGPMFQGLLVSRAALTRTGLLDERIVSYQEWETAIRLAKHYPAAFVPEPTFVYDCSRKDTISKEVRRAALGYTQVFTRYQGAILRHLGPAALAHHYQIAGLFYWQAHDYTTAWCFWTIAILLWPFRPGLLLRRVRRGVEYVASRAKTQMRKDGIEKSTEHRTP